MDKHCASYHMPSKPVLMNNDDALLIGKYGKTCKYNINSCQVHNGSILIDFTIYLQLGKEKPSLFFLYSSYL